MRRDPLHRTRAAARRDPLPLRPVSALARPCRRLHLGARADVSLEEAEALVWFASSARGRRGFCGSCGSSLFFKAARGDRLAIAAGSLDQPSGLAVIGHEYVADRADYVRIDDGLPACAGDFRAPATEGL
jgi:hypothetical protein